jgi:hypothetical protein
MLAGRESTEPDDLALWIMAEDVMRDMEPIGSDGIAPSPTLRAG